MELFQHVTILIHALVRGCMSRRSQIIECIKRCRAVNSSQLRLSTPHRPLNKLLSQYLCSQVATLVRTLTSILLDFSSSSPSIGDCCQLLLLSAIRWLAQLYALVRIESDQSQQCSGKEGPFWRDLTLWTGHKIVGSMKCMDKVCRFMDFRSTETAAINDFSYTFLCQVHFK